MNPRKNQHTNIIDDLDAISLAQQSGKRKAAPKKKKDKTGGAGAPAPPVASGSKAQLAKKAAVTPQDGGASRSPVAGSSKARPPKKKAAPKATGPRFHEKNGAKIPLYEKSFKKRGHARLASGLRNKNTDFLLGLVGEYTSAAKRKEFEDADKAKAEMADWIEKQETYTLGPNPLSKLDITSKTQCGSMALMSTY